MPGDNNGTLRLCGFGLIRPFRDQPWTQNAAVSGRQAPASQVSVRTCTRREDVPRFSAAGR